MRVNACVEHTRYYGSLDFTPIEPQEEGHVLATAVSADGVVRLDCYFCQWATPSLVLDKLASTGDMILTTPPQPIVNKTPRIVNIPKKEKNVAKDKKTPTTRDRRPSLTKTLNFEGVQVTLTIKGTFEALLACDPQDLEHIKALQNLMEPDGMDKGEA